MRTLSSFDQEERKRKLLQAIIHQYIKTAKPVGSAFLADQYKLDLSSATIRNVMAELEEEGFLTHPHTSAGRVPTDKAYRFYVDSLADLQRLAQLEEQRIQSDYQERIRQIEELMSTTTKTLSVMSKYTGFVTAPNLEQAHLRHLELVPLDNDRVLVVMVADSGMVKHRVVAFQRHYPKELLPSLARMMNEQLGGKTFSEVRENILDHIEHAGQRQLDLIEMARGITNEAFEMVDDEIYMEGTSNILSLPDFRDFDQVRSLAYLLDEKRLIGDAINKSLEDAEISKKWPGVQVKIGAENKIPQLSNLSVVTATYTIHNRTVGVLGIIGPKRMEYPRMMGLVSYVAKSVSKVLNKLTGGDE